MITVECNNPDCESGGIEYEFENDALTFCGGCGNVIHRPGD